MKNLNVDVAIMGGGIMGSAAALQLRKAGYSVALLERGVCGAQASGINSGGVRQQGRALAELPLTRRAIAIWHKMSELLGEDVEFRQVGHVRMAFTDKEFAVIEDYAPKARNFGLQLHVMGASEARMRYGWISDKIVGASLSPECGHANPRLVTPAYVRAARRIGVEVHEFTPVTAAQWTGHAFEIECGSLLAVKSRYFVNCSGAWAAQVCDWFGEGVTVPLRSPNQIVTEPIPRLITHSVSTVAGTPYFRQVERGNVILGGGPGWGDLQEDCARPVTSTTINAYSKIINLVPALRGVTIIRCWSGLEGDTLDKVPVISPSSTTPNLVHAFGFSGHGFQLGPAVGEVIAELVQNGRSTTSIELLDIKRFLSAAEQQSPATH